MGLIFNNYTYNVEIVLKDKTTILGTVDTGFARDTWLNDSVFSEEWVTIDQGDKRTAIKTEDISVVYVTEKKEVNCSKNCKSEDCYLFQAIETLINEYSNLKQIEEAHRIENGELRERIKQLEEIDSHIPHID